MTLSLAARTGWPFTRGQAPTLLLVPLETRFSPEPAGLIVLGGGIDPALSAAHGTPVFDSAGARIVVAAALAHQYPNARLVYAGGNANLIHNEAREADATAAVFESLGIARDRLQIERQSRNTQETSNSQTRRTLASSDVCLPHAQIDRAVLLGRICPLPGRLADVWLVRRLCPASRFCQGPVANRGRRMVRAHDYSLNGIHGAPPQQFACDGYCDP